jgi:hypothetical protein
MDWFMAHTPEEAIGERHVLLAWKGWSNRMVHGCVLHLLMQVERMLQG